MKNLKNIKFGSNFSLSIPIGDTQSVVIFNPRTGGNPIDICQYTDILML